MFKSGRSLGHAHSDQNSYTIYKGGRPLTAGPGYVTSWAEYDVTWAHNSITVGDDSRVNGLEYGLGQAQEPGDLGIAPLGTVGVVEEVVIEVEDEYQGVVMHGQAL